MAEEVEVNKQGAAEADLNPGEKGNGPNPPPAESNKAPPKDDGKDEEHGTLAKKDKDKVPDKKQEPEPKPEPDEDDDKTDWKNQYIEFEDEAGQNVVELLKEANVKPVEANAIFEEAVKTGDLSKVRWDLLEARLGKAKARLARTGIEQHYNEVWSKHKATQDFAYEHVGGEENWNKIAKWVKATEKADPKLKTKYDSLRRAIDIGGEAAEMAVQRFKSMYESADGNSSLSGADKLTRGDKKASPEGKPLTRAESIKLLHEANRKGDAAAMAAIRARRAAGRAAGI